MPRVDIRNPSELQQFLTNAQIKELLALWIAEPLHVEFVSDLPEKGVVYKIDSGQGVCVIRFPLDKGQEAALQRESKITKELYQYVRIKIPETTFFRAEQGRPAFAIHRWVDGIPLTSEMYDQMPETSKWKLTLDLAEFLVTVHSIDLEKAMTWYDTGTQALFTQTNYGKPLWFPEQLRARILGILIPYLEQDLVAVVTDIVRAFDDLAVSRKNLVLGHGDIHGYNLTMRPTGQDYELSGIIDFEIAGIQDVHEDFFRLHFISSEFVERTVRAYEEKRKHKVLLDMGRITLYWRAFLIYLMMEHLEADNLELFELYKDLLIDKSKRP